MTAKKSTPPDRASRASAPAPVPEGTERTSYPLAIDPASDTRFDAMIAAAHQGAPDPDAPTTSEG